MGTVITSEGMGIWGISVSASYSLIFCSFSFFFFCKIHYRYVLTFTNREKGKLHVLEKLYIILNAARAYESKHSADRRRETQVAPTPSEPHFHLHHLPWPSPPNGVELSPSGLQKGELASKSSKHAKEASGLPLGQPLIHPEKRASSTSNKEYEGESQTGVLTQTRNPHGPDD